MNKCERELMEVFKSEDVACCAICSTASLAAAQPCSWPYSQRRCKNICWHIAPFKKDATINSLRYVLVQVLARLPQNHRFHARLRLAQLQPTNASQDVLQARVERRRLDGAAQYTYVLNIARRAFAITSTDHRFGLEE